MANQKNRNRKRKAIQQGNPGATQRPTTSKPQVLVKNEISHFSVFEGGHIPPEVLDQYPEDSRQTVMRMSEREQEARHTYIADEQAFVIAIMRRS